MPSSPRYLDTARLSVVHPRAKTITAVRGCSVDANRENAKRIDGIHADMRWAWEQLGDALEMTAQDAARLCGRGKATAGQLAMVQMAAASARAVRRAA